VRVPLGKKTIDVAQQQIGRAFVEVAVRSENPHS
jgi:hypothetical protein